MILWFSRNVINHLELSAMYTKNSGKGFKIVKSDSCLMSVLYSGWGWGLQYEETRAICRYCPFLFSFWVPFPRFISKNMQVNGSVCFTSVQPPRRSISGTLWHQSFFLSLVNLKSSTIWNTSCSCATELLQLLLSAKLFISNFYLSVYRILFKNKGASNM